MKKFISLIVGIFVFALLIQPVFATDEADLEALIADAAIADCSNSLVADYDSLAATVDDAMKETVAGYYNNDFTENYDGDPGVDTKLAALDDKGVYLQYHYLANNPSAVGSKQELGDAADGSTWSTTHAGCHDNLVAELDGRGAYDFFVVNTSGDIVYTVYKETDLGTNLSEGSFSDSGLGQAYKAASDSGALSISDVAPYWPSYEDDAQFVCAPIGADGATFCLQITPDQLADTGDIRED